MSEILAHVLAPIPLVAVILGAGLIALAQQGFAALSPALAALWPLVTARPETDRDAARAVLLRAEQVAHEHDVSRIDRLRARHVFLAEALADRHDRHQRAIGFWGAVADAAPAMGMAGTILGLIGMFARMDDPATIGPAMALALMTTLHGMILANAVAGPISARLADISRRELAWQREVADRLIAIARRETPQVAALRVGMRDIA
jgi:chemotaxis protein MotA